MKKLLALILIALSLASSAKEMPGNVRIWSERRTSLYPDRNINVTFRDSEGYIWSGTRNGLLRDDGYRTVSFKPSDGTLNVFDITQFPDGNLLVGAEEGAYVFEKATLSFSRFDARRTGNESVEKVFFTSDGSAWISQKGKLRRYDASGVWKADYPIVNRRGKPSQVTGFAETRDGSVWISSYSNGLWRYDRSADRFVMAGPAGIDVSFGKIIEDSRNPWLWVKDFEGSLYRFDPSLAPSPAAYVKSPGAAPGKDEKRERVTDFLQDDSDGWIWTISRNNVSAFRPHDNGTLEWIDLSDFRQLHGAIMTTMCRMPGGIWVTTFDNGDFLIEIGSQDYSPMRVDAINERYGNTPVIQDLAVGNGGLLWLMQGRTGPLLFDPSSGVVADHEKEGRLNHLRLYRATRMTRSERHGGVWVSRNREGTVYALANTGMKMACVDSIELPPLNGPRHDITAMFEDTSGTLWVASQGTVWQFDKIGTMRKHVGSGQVMAFAETGDRTVWAVGNESGLLRLSGKAGATDKPVGTVANPTALTADREGNLWVATAAGNISRFSPADSKWADFTGMTGTAGLPVLSIQADKASHLWIFTSLRAMEFNPANGAKRIFQLEGDDGPKAFLTTSTAVDGRGNVLAGGVGGIALFRPGKSLDSQYSIATPVLSDVKVNGGSILAGDSLRRKNGDKIRLLAGDHNVVFEFTTLNHRFAGQQHFAYRLRGLEKEWNETTVGENRATYNRIPRGKHLLEIKVCDENSLWSEAETLAVVVQEPFWYETWWAFAIYGVLATGLVAAGTLWLLRRQKRSNEEIWADSKEMVKMRQYLTSPVNLPEEEFRQLDKALLKKATRVVEANLANASFGVDDLAAGVNMSRSSLSRKLKAITGETPLSFILDIKMKHACRLLESHNHTVNEVAENVGFEDRRYFTNKFRQSFGVTPSAYLKLSQGERDEILARNESKGSQRKGTS